MQNNDFLLINNIIYQIYNTPNFDTMRTTFLHLLKMLIPNTYSSILMADNSGIEPVLCNPICVPASFTDTELLYLKIEPEDPTRWLVLCKQSAVIRESELISTEEFLQSKVYQQCYKPKGIYYSMQLHLAYHNMFLGVVSLYRKREDGDFSDYELFIMKAFMEHLNICFYHHLDEASVAEYNRPSIDALISKYHITKREAEIITFILDNYSNEQITDKLCISNYTLKKHLQNLYRKLDISSRWDLLRLAKEMPQK